MKKVSKLVAFLVIITLILVPLAACEGVPGPSGSPGPMGPQGPAGPEGSSGPPGSADEGFIYDSSVTTSKIATGSVTSAKIRDGTIATVDLADDSITSAKIDEADGTSGQDTDTGSGVKTGHIQDNAVTSEKLADAITIADTLTVTGTTTLIGSLDPQGDIAKTTAADLDIASAAGQDVVLSPGGTAQLTASPTGVTIAGTLSVTGITTLTGSLDPQGDIAKTTTADLYIASATAYDVVLSPGGTMVQLRASSTGVSIGGTLLVNGNLTAPIFYDQNNPAYYLDPASTSNLNNLTVTGNTTLGDTASDVITFNGTVASFVNAQHDHEDAAGGGTLDAAAIASGTLANARLSANVSLLGQSISSAEIVNGTVAQVDLAVKYEAGTIIIPTGSVGNGAVQVFYTVSFPSTPVVVATVQQLDPTGIVYVTSATTTSFIINVAGSSVISGNLSVGWVAVE